jgi:hypothetical protein
VTSQEVYITYKAYCDSVGVPPSSFEDWFVNSERDTDRPNRQFESDNKEGPNARELAVFWQKKLIGGGINTPFGGSK